MAMVSCKKLITLLILLSLALCLCACAAGEGQAILGDWESSAEIHALGQSKEQEASLGILTTRLSFYEDGTGIWISAFDDGHPTVSRSFTYVAENGAVILRDEDGREERYAVSVGGGVLILEDSRASLQLTRAGS